MENTRKELEILESVHHASLERSRTPLRQRDLAEIAGLSLGMTNAILKRLVQKGLITIKKVNNRNIRYAVSPEGLDVIMRRSYGYFKRTIKHVVRYRETIEELSSTIKKNGFDGIVLVGQSDLDFIIEHACGRYGLVFMKNSEKFNGRLFTIYSENHAPGEQAAAEAPDSGRPLNSDTAYLQKIIIGL